MNIKKTIETAGLIIFAMIMLICVIIPQWIILMMLIFIADILVALGKLIKMQKKEGA